MGCFNHTSSISGVPVKYGDRIVVIIGLQIDKGNNGYWAPGDGFVPISVPIRGIYDDYGAIEEVDRTPGIESLEKCFGMDVINIVKCAERIQCGCENQIDYEKICQVVKTIVGRHNFSLISEQKVELTYIMEHESMFDYLMSEYNTKIKDRSFWRIPHEYIEKLGYKKNVIGNDNGHDVIMWKHDNLPTLKEKYYVWLESEYNDYGKISHSFASLCERIGCDVPEYFEKSFFEDEFEKNMRMDENNLFIDRNKCEYSFRHGVYEKHGLFMMDCGNTYSSFILSQFENDKDMLQDQYKKEVCEIAALMSSMTKLQKVWLPTISHSQEIDYEQNIKFIEKALEIAKVKYQEYTEE